MYAVLSPYLDRLARRIQESEKLQHQVLLLIDPKAQEVEASRISKIISNGIVYFKYTSR